MLSLNYGNWIELHIKFGVLKKKLINLLNCIQNEQGKEELPHCFKSINIKEIKNSLEYQ